MKISQKFIDVAEAEKGMKEIRRIQKAEEIYS
jgi:hypothetical protein